MDALPLSLCFVVPYSCLPKGQGLSNFSAAGNSCPCSHIFNWSQCLAHLASWAPRSHEQFSWCLALGPSMAKQCVWLGDPKTTDPSTAPHPPANIRDHFKFMQSNSALSMAVVLVTPFSFADDFSIWPSFFPRMLPGPFNNLLRVPSMRGLSLSYFHGPCSPSR